MPGSASTAVITPAGIGQQRGVGRLVALHAALRARLLELRQRRR